jgi:hypothetical protein
MTTLFAYHEVNDVQHWLASTVRDEIFATVGATATPFVVPESANQVGILIEAPDVEKLQEMLGSQAGAEAMAADGVRPETIVILAKA